MRDRIKAARRISEPFHSLISRALQISSHVTMGKNPIKRGGVGEEFWQFKNYEFGDPISSIDWRQSAKSDGYFIRQNQHHMKRQLALIVDHHGGMKWQNKYDHGVILALALGHVAYRSGENVYWNNKSVGTFSRLCHDMEHGHDDTTYNRKHIIWFGDFLKPIKNIQNEITNHIALGNEIMLVQIATPQEQQFPFSGSVQFESMDNGTPYQSEKSQNLKNDYLQKYNDHFHQLWEFTDDNHIPVIHHVTDIDLSTTFRHIMNEMG